MKSCDCGTNHDPVRVSVSFPCRDAAAQTAHVWPIRCNHKLSLLIFLLLALVVSSASTSRPSLPGSVAIRGACAWRSDGAKFPFQQACMRCLSPLFPINPFFFLRYCSPSYSPASFFVLHACSSAVVVALLSSLLLSLCCFAVPDYLHKVWPRLRHRSRIRTRESVIVFGLQLCKSDSQPITDRLASFLVLGWPGGRCLA